MSGGIFASLPDTARLPESLVSEDARPTLRASVFWPCIAAIFTIAVALRVFSLAKWPLWLDEAYSAWFSALPLEDLWTKVPNYETHPPLYYTVLKGWCQLFGTSEAGLRSLSVLSSVVAVLLLSASGRLLKSGRKGEAVSLLAGLLLAVNAGNIKYAQEARPYALETLAVTMALVASAGLLAGLRRQSDATPKQFVPWAVMLAVSGGLLLWCHNTAPFVAVGIWCGLGTAIVMQRAVARWKTLALAIASGIGALVIWAPFLPWFVRQGESFGAMQFWLNTSRYDLIAAWVLAAGGVAPAITAIVLAMPGIRVLWRHDRTLTVNLCLVLLIPLVLVLSVSFFVKPIFIDRLFGWMAPPLMLLIASGIVGVSRSFGGMAMLCSVVLCISLQAVATGYAEPRIEDFRRLTDDIATQALPGDIAVVVPNEIGVALQYYGHRPGFVDAVYLPGPFPYLNGGLERHYIGNLGAPAISRADVENLQQRLRGYSRIWLITRRIDLYDPKDFVQQALSAVTKPVADMRFGLVKVQLLERSAP